MVHNNYVHIHNYISMFFFLFKDIEGSIKGSIKNKVQMIGRSPVAKVGHDEVYFEVAGSEKTSPGRHSASYTMMDDG